MGVFDRIRAAGAALIGKEGAGIGSAALPSQGYLPTLGSTPSAAGVLISHSGYRVGFWAAFLAVCAGFAGLLLLGRRDRVQPV